MINQYGLSRNLFDLNSYTSPIVVTDGVATGTVQQFFSAKIDIPSSLYGKWITYSARIKRSGTPSSWVHVQVTDTETSTSYIGNNITSADGGVSSVCFPANATTKIYINFTGTNTDTLEVSEVMLYEGAITIPYSLKGSNTWNLKYEYIYGASKNLINQATWINSTTDTRANFNLSITVYKGGTSLGERRLDITEAGFKSLTTASGANGIDKVLIKHNGSTRDLAIATIENLDVPANTPLTFSLVVNNFKPSTEGGINIQDCMLVEGSKALPYQVYNSTGWQPYFEHKYTSNAWS